MRPLRSAGHAGHAPRLASRLALPTLLLLTGCASNGPPKPPSLNLPNPAKDLHAERVGNVVQLTWTTPADNTDDLPVKPPLTAEICRDPAPAPSAPGKAHPCTVVLRLPAKPGPSSATDPLPPALQADPVTLLLYRVRLLNAAGRSAATSNTASAAGGSAPAPVSGFHALLAPGGNRLLWDPQPATAAVPAAVVLLRSAATASPSTPKAVAPTRLLAAPQASAADGTVDATAPLDVPLRYIAERVRTVTVAGHELTLRSPASAPLLVQFRDITPPRTPAGLQAVVDAPSVDLSWEPNTEPDLAGYWIERSLTPPGAPASWQRLNPSLLPVPAFHDTPPPTASLRYRLFAVDTAGNISPPTPPLSVVLPSP